MEAAKRQVNIPVQLMAVCNTNGDLIPRWFRYEDGEHCIQSVCIQQVLSWKELEYVGIRILQYICQAEVCGRKRIFELRYHVDSHRWSFFQMLDEE